MEQTPTVTIEGKEYPIGLATIGHAEAIAPVVGLFLQAGDVGVQQAVHDAGDLIHAVAVVTDCPREIVARQPLVEFIRILEEAAAGFIDRNAAYVQDKVVPAIEDLQQRAGEVMRAAAEQDDGGTPPAAE